MLVKKSFLKLKDQRQRHGWTAQGKVTGSMSEAGTTLRKTVNTTRPSRGSNGPRRNSGPVSSGHKISVLLVLISLTLK